MFWEKKAMDGRGKPIVKRCCGTANPAKIHLSSCEWAINMKRILQCNNVWISNSISIIVDLIYIYIIIVCIYIIVHIFLYIYVYNIINTSLSSSTITYFTTLLYFPAAPSPELLEKIGENLQLFGQEPCVVFWREKKPAGNKNTHLWSLMFVL